MNVKVINIQEQYERILYYLFPEYSASESAASTSRFIAHRNVKTKMEREVLDYQYDNCVFISNQIFDEVWDEEKIKKEVIEFSRVKFKNRKTKFEPSSENFVDDCINFMFGLSVDEEEASIFELFNLFGSANFVKKFVELSLTIPYQVLAAALSTFVMKVVAQDNSLYYKKKSIIYGPKIKENYLKALDDFNLRGQDSFGLSVVKFYSDLFYD